MLSYTKFLNLLHIFFKSSAWKCAILRWSTLSFFYFCYIVIIIIVLLKGICLACGDDKVCAQHPLFDGGLCKECKVSIQNKSIWVYGWYMHQILFHNSNWIFCNSIHLNLLSFCLVDIIPGKCISVWWGWFSGRRMFKMSTYQSMYRKEMLVNVKIGRSTISLISDSQLNTVKYDKDLKFVLLRNVGCTIQWSSESHESQLF